MGVVGTGWTSVWGAAVAGPTAPGVEAASGMEAATSLWAGTGAVSVLLQAAMARAAVAAAARRRRRLMARSFGRAFAASTR